jgi:hypothetical protein
VSLSPSTPPQTPTINIGTGRLRPRALAIGVAAIALNAIWLVRAEMVRWSLYTNAAPFCNAIFTLLVLVGANALCVRLRPGRPEPLNRFELLCIFTMTSIGAALASGQFMQLLIEWLPAPTGLASRGSHWQETFIPHLPKWAMVTDTTAVRGFYGGSTSIYRRENLLPWLLPALYWSLWVMVLLWTLVCLTTVMRRQWISNERLTYPTVYLPMEMTAGPAFWRSPLFRLGFALAAVITLYNGFAYLHPNLPMLPIRRQDLSVYMTNPPWKSIGGFQTSFYLFAIGISFLMPQDLSFSLWIFYLLYKLEIVACAAMGTEAIPEAVAGFDANPPYEHGQAFGAYIAVCVLALRSALPYLRDVWRTAFARGAGPLDDSNEPMRYRTAVLGLGIGLAALVALSYSIGMSPGVAVAFFAVYILLALVVTRMRAEFGFPVHDMSSVGPANVIMASEGTRALGPANLTSFGIANWFNRTYFAHPMPHQLEGMKLADTAGGSGRQILKAMMLAGLAGTIAAFWAYLHVAYTLGAGTANVERWARVFPYENYRDLSRWIRTPARINVAGMEAAGGGFLLAMALGILRQRLPWFPLHPLAYAVANSWGMAQIWMPVMVGSLAKAVILHYGGLRGYRRAVPLFLGLILGEMTLGCLWTLVGIAIGVHTYDFWP